MLSRLELSDISELFSDIPAKLKLVEPLNIPLGQDEANLLRRASMLARNTIDLSSAVSFLGCGSYDHFVPAVVRSITSRSEFATAYTPYQPELSQGTLQAIFEFQSSIAALTALPVANASLYDGATAVAEACTLAEQVTRRSRVVVLDTVSPQVRRVLLTYAHAYGIDVELVQSDLVSGTVAKDSLAQVLGDDVAAVVVQQPNAFGLLEDAPALVELSLAAGAVPVVCADPISLGVLEAPGNYGAHVVVGDGQPLGIAPTGGGPSFGFMAATEHYLRRMPGRIVGETVDSVGHRGYVLTLQTREQHIRRDKATSNICTNQALCALAGLVYLSWLGPQGIRELAAIQFERASATRERLLQIPGVTAGPGGSDAAVFREFAVKLPVNANELSTRSANGDGILIGWPAQRGWSEFDEGMLLVAATEQRTDDDIEQLAETIERQIGAMQS